MTQMHLQTFLSKPVTQKYQILSCDILVANKRYDKRYRESAVPDLYERVLQKTSY